MKPQEFLTLAERLVAVPHEAELRSAVSRAYYCVFHSARLLVETCGVQVPLSASAHDKVDKCLQNSGNNELILAGRALNTLRSARNQADYRLLDRQFQDVRYVQVWVKTAKQVQEAIDSAEGNIEAFRGTIKSYARGILRLRTDPGA
jgi:uncharacterized protein (UPF0332 family)